MLDYYTMVLQAEKERTEANEMAKVSNLHQDQVFETFTLFLENGDSVEVTTQEQLDALLNTM